MNAALKHAIEGSILQSVRVPDFKNTLLLLEFRKGSQVYCLSVEPEDVHSEAYLADGLEELQSLVGSEIQSFDIEEGEYVVEDHGNMGWSFYKFQGTNDSVTLRFNSYADQFYSVGVNMKCDKIKTDKLFEEE